jgi:hypothetical protein
VEGYVKLERTEWAHVVGEAKTVVLKKKKEKKMF